MSGSPSPRDKRWLRHLRVALNAADGLPHDAALRLAMRPAEWLDEPDTARARRATGVGAKAIATAREIARDALRAHRVERRRARAAGAEIVTPLDDEYPVELSDLELPPAVLYRAGKLPTAPGVAIVGSRNADVYGRQVAERLAGDLAAAGLVVVSGFAVGVDGAAHRGALAAGGSTVAVLGCGVDVDYPRAHRRLRGEIERGGARVSEWRMGTAPEAHRFPIRNRIIAALAVGTLVVRAAPRSGSLITARLALDLGRIVWAVPGNISDRRSVGVNSLIRDGAHPVQEARDVLESLPYQVRDRLAEPEVPVPETGAETPATLAAEPVARAVLESLPRDEPLAQDRLIAATGLPAEKVLATLLTLELDGRVRRYPGPAYCRRR